MALAGSIQNGQTELTISRFCGAVLDKTADGPGRLWGDRLEELLKRAVRDAYEPTCNGLPEEQIDAAVRDATNDIRRRVNWLASPSMIAYEFWTFTHNSHPNVCRRLYELSKP